MPTIIGGVVFLIGFLLLLRGSVEAMFVFTAYTTLMVGSAALYIGSSSILPSLVALGFLSLRVLLPGARNMHTLRIAANSNILLLAFSIYCFVGAIILPYVFKGAIDVIPMRIVTRHTALVAKPVSFSAQNVTTAVYTLGSYLMAVVSFVAARQPRTARLMPMVAVTVVAIHVFFGISDALFGNTAYGAVIDFFRNGAYAQLDQAFGEVARIKGICPEPSSYATYGMVWFVFASELWLRDIRPRLTGPAAAAMGLTLFASTSTTAYASLAIYMVLIVGRCLLMPSTLRASKVLMIGAIGLGGLLIGCLLMLLHPSLATQMATILFSSTLGKGNSSSGQMRMLLVEQSLQSFVASYGLGVGAGSFRSSSLAASIVGSAGVIGVITFVCYILHVWKPLRRSTYTTRVTDLRLAVGASASWTTLVAMGTASVSAASSDPGAVGMMFAGLALGLRSMARPARPRPANEAPRFVDPALEARALPVR